MAEILFQHGGLAISLLHGEAEAAFLVALFSAVAIEKQWQAGTDLAPAPDVSLYFAAHRNGELAGGIHVRRPDLSGGLPIFETWPEILRSNRGSTSELVVLALAPEFRGTPRLLWTLCTEMWRYCTRIGLTGLLIAIPVRNYRIYQRLGWSLEVLGDERTHWGEGCIPCRIDLGGAADSVTKKARSSPSMAFIAEQAYRP